MNGLLSSGMKESSKKYPSESIELKDIDATLFSILKQFMYTEKNSKIEFSKHDGSYRKVKYVWNQETY